MRGGVLDMKLFLACFIVVSALFGAEISKSDMADLIKKCDEKDKVACGEVSKIYGKIAKQSQSAESMKLWVDYAIKGCELKDGESCYTIAYHYAKAGVASPRFFEADNAKKEAYLIKGCDYGFAQSCYILGLINYDNFYKKNGDKNKFKQKSKQFIQRACDLEFEKACGENWDLP